MLNSFKTQEQMLKHKQKEDLNMAKAKKLLAQQKYNDARQLTAKQMMADESMLDDEDPNYRQTDRNRENELNDTYANFDDSASEEEDQEEYNSEEEKSPKQARGRAGIQRSQTKDMSNYNSSRNGNMTDSKASFDRDNSSSFGNYSTNDQSATGKKSKKSMTSKLFNGMNKKINKFF